MTKQEQIRQRVVQLIQELGVGAAIPSERRRGMVPDSRTIGLENVHAGPQVGRALHVSPDARVYRIRRLRLADDVPMAVETLHVAVSLVPGLTPAKLEHASFYELLEQRYGVVIASGLQTIEPTVTNEEESQLLAVPLHSPAFLFERTSQTADGETVEYVRSIYRGDRYRLVAELSQRRESVYAERDGG